MSKLTGQKIGKQKVEETAPLKPKRMRCVNYGGHRLTIETDWNEKARKFYMAKIIIDGKEAIVDKDEVIGYLRIE